MGKSVGMYHLAVVNNGKIVCQQKEKKFNLFVRNKDGKNFSTIQKKLVHSELNDATPDCSEKINFYATMWTVATNDKEDTEDKGREQKEEWMKKKNTTKMKQSQR